MNRYLAILTFLMIMAASFGQLPAADSIREGGNGFIPRKFDYHVSAGSMFTTSSGFGSGLTSYISPSVSYGINSKLRIGGGFSVINTTFFNAKSWYAPESVPGYSGNMSSVVLFVNGQYMVNDRLTISGSAYKQVPLYSDPLPYNPYYPMSGQDAQGIDLNVAYKIGRNSSIHLGFGYSKGMNPYFSDPFNASPFSSGSLFPGSSFNR
jgi:hypothetical protein